MWWQAATEDDKKSMRELVQSGQLEITGGGWVMNDEVRAKLSKLLLVVPCCASLVTGRCDDRPLVALL